MRIRFRYKLLLAFFGVGVLLAAVTVWQVYSRVRVLPVSITRYLLMAATANSARGIDADLIGPLAKELELALQKARLEEPDKKFSQTRAGRAYIARLSSQKLRRQMQLIDEAPPHFGPERLGRASRYMPGAKGYEKYVYIIVRTGKKNIGRVLTCVSTDDIGAEYDMATYPAMLKAWQETHAEDDLTYDTVHSQRRTLGAWSPIRDPSGQAVALLGIDAQAKPIVQFKREIILSTIWIFGLTVGLALIAALYISWRMNKPITLLSKGIENIRSGRIDIRIPEVNTCDEFEDLVNNFNEMARGLGERDQLRASLVLAGEIQKHLLPLDVPSVAGFDIFGGINYCDESGGDYYDFINVDAEQPGSGRKLGIAIGDVTGHGIAAALLMATGRALLRSHAQHHNGSIAEMFDDVNQHLVRDTDDDRFMTLFYGELDADSGMFAYASAGHDPVLWYHGIGGKIDLLGNTGIPLGILEDMPFTQSEPMKLSCGDLLVMSTDGIGEAKNPAGEMFGQARLVEVVRANSEKSAHEIYDAIVEAVGQFQADRAQDDDITLVIVKCLPAAEQMNE